VTLSQLLLRQNLKFRISVCLLAEESVGVLEVPLFTFFLSSTVSHITLPLIFLIDTHNNTSTMRFSNLLVVSATLFLLTKEAHGASSSDFSPTTSRSSPARRKLSSSSATSGKKKKRRRKSKASGTRKSSLPVGLVDDDMFDFPLGELDEDEDEERLLSALDRIDGLGTSKGAGSTTKKGKKKTSKKRKRSSSIDNDVGMRSTGLSRPTSASVRSVPLSKEPKVSSNTKEQTFVPPAVGAEQTAPVAHTVTQHTYHHRTPTPTNAAGGLPYRRYRPPVAQARAPPQNPQQQQRAAMLAYTTPWVINFLQARPKDALLAVPRDFLGDGFNLVHLPPIVERLVGSSDTSFSLYKAALRLILSNEDVQNVPPSVQRAAETLYTLVHARYITSPRGLDTVRRLLVQNKEVFGKCPRPSCRGMPMLPHGETSDYGQQQHTHHGLHGNANNCHAQRYCCCCGNVWEHWDSKVDGSAWGPSFCHLYLLTYGKDALGGRLAHSAVPQNPSTLPTIFGFQVHTAALRRLHEL
jgi:casein kinase II subunit beta